MTAPVPTPGACETLRDAFALLPDSRRAHGKQHPQTSILLLCIIALLSGSKNPSQIFVFGRLRVGLLRRLGFHPPKERSGPKPKNEPSCPNEDTISATLRRLPPGALNDCLGQWIARLLPAEVHAAVDGKALRGAEEHVLEVFANDLRLALWQMPVDKKENELSALEKNLGEVLSKFPQIKLLTGDAMFCQKSIAKTVHAARRHYFLQLKAPHKTDVGIATEAMKQITSTPSLAHAVEKRGVRTGANL